MPQSRRTKHQEIINHQYPNQLYIQNLNEQIFSDSTDVVRIFWLENRFKSRSDINDAEQIEENETDAGNKEKDCYQLIGDQNQILSNFIASLNFLNLQLKRGGVHLKKHNKNKSRVALQKGWNALIFQNKQVLNEIFWWIAVMTSNK
ncbi:MAG: hypothetical protein EZS28_020379 [Streblomastix strix]|uniref:Uncharacterized protein n=1 Tax=Streblomastix strix TaxID=222440 RepID=A0A5J4VND9_9EUKA|nr:MAG: hypothetical protein EZS28_020379 [Streblomastix strix]